MSDLDSRIREELDSHYMCCGAMEDALRAVLDVHSPTRDEYMAEKYGGDWLNYECPVCLTSADEGVGEKYPCETVRAIIRELDMKEN